MWGGLVSEGEMAGKYYAPITNAPSVHVVRANYLGWQQGLVAASANTNKSQENSRVLQSFKVLKVRSPSPNISKVLCFL